MFTLANYLGCEGENDAAELTAYAQGTLLRENMQVEDYTMEEVEWCRRAGIGLLDEVEVLETEDAAGDTAEERLINTCNEADKRQGVCIVVHVDTLQTYYWKNGVCVLEKQGFVKEGRGEFGLVRDSKQMDWAEVETDVE